MFDNEQITLTDIPLDKIDKPFGYYRLQTEAELWCHEGSGSGGYANFILQYAARELFQINDPKFKFRNLRNPDFREAILEHNGQILLRFGVANGFRNIQNLVQKLKKEKCNYHYVEVMACPAGKYIYFN